MAGKRHEEFVREVLKRKYPESKGWHINPHLALRDVIVDFVLFKGNPMKMLQRGYSPERIVFVEAKDVNRLTRDHVWQLADYISRVRRFIVDEAILVVSERTKITSDVLDYAGDHDIQVMVLREGFFSDDFDYPKTED